MVDPLVERALEVPLGPNLNRGESGPEDRGIHRAFRIDVTVHVGRARQGAEAEHARRAVERPGGPDALELPVVEHRGRVPEPFLPAGESPWGNLVSGDSVG